jgi:hypothetical protein
MNHPSTNAPTCHPPNTGCMKSPGHQLHLWTLLHHQRPHLTHLQRRRIATMKPPGRMTALNLDKHKTLHKPRLSHLITYPPTCCNTQNLCHHKRHPRHHVPRLSAKAQRHTNSPLPLRSLKHHHKQHDPHHKTNLPLIYAHACTLPDNGCVKPTGHQTCP